MGSISLVHVSLAVVRWDIYDKSDQKLQQNQKEIRWFDQLHQFLSEQPSRLKMLRLKKKHLNQNEIHLFYFTLNLHLHFQKTEVFM